MADHLPLRGELHGLVLLLQVLRLLLVLLQLLLDLLELLVYGWVQEGLPRLRQGAHAEALPQI